MVGSIQSLRNMEYMLYGNTPAFGSFAAPSMVNNYCAASPYLNSYMYNNPYSPYLYNNSQSVFNQPYYMQNGAQASQADIDKIADFYNENSQPSESLAGAVAGGAAFGLFNNGRLLAHPLNSVSASRGATKAMFADVKTAGTTLNKLWAAPETNELMRNAYAAMHKTEARSMTKIGAFRKRFSEADYNTLKGYMDSALKSGDKAKIAEATAKLEQAYVNDGWLGGRVGKLLDKIREMRGKPVKPRTVAEALNDTNAITEKSKALMDKTTTFAAGKTGMQSFKEILKRGGGVKGGLLMMAAEVLMGIGNIREAFSKDNKTGFIQVGQTLIKGAGNAAGWAIGEAAGIWAATKICAAVGTAIAPGLGTAIGAVLGLIGGSVGCWLTGKFTKALVGQDVGEKVKIEKMKQTPEGQAQLLQLTMQQKNIPLHVQQSMQNVAMQYAA